jgi:hypothetical protein
MEMIPLIPYKDREHVKDEIRFCANMAMGFTIGVFLFLALGVISDALNTVLVLHSTMWFLVSIICGMGVLVSHMHVVAAKQFLGIEAESKEE